MFIHRIFSNTELLHQIKYDQLIFCIVLFEYKYQEFLRTLLFSIPRKRGNNKKWYLRKPLEFDGQHVLQIFSKMLFLYLCYRYQIRNTDSFRDKHVNTSFHSPPTSSSIFIVDLDLSFLNMNISKNKRSL